MKPPIIHHFRWRSPRHVITCGAPNGHIQQHNKLPVNCKNCLRTMAKRGWSDPYYATVPELVTITATREELWGMGVCSESTFELLLSGKPVTVKERRQTAAGVMVYVSGNSEGHWLWVWERFTRRVDATPANV